jgi:hypothetical protein
MKKRVDGIPAAILVVPFILLYRNVTQTAISRDNEYGFLAPAPATKKTEKRRNYKSQELKVKKSE